MGLIKDKYRFIDSLNITELIKEADYDDVVRAFANYLVRLDGTLDELILGDIIDNLPIKGKIWEKYSKLAETIQGLIPED